MINQLVQLTSPRDRKVSGKVVGLDKNVVAVSTKEGIVHCPVTMSGVSLGDTVLVERGSIVGRLPPANEVLVYQV